MFYNAKSDISKPKDGSQQLKSLLLIFLTNLHHVHSILEIKNQQSTLDLISFEEQARSDETISLHYTVTCYFPTHSRYYILPSKWTTVILNMRRAGRRLHAPSKNGTAWHHQHCRLTNSCFGSNTDTPRRISNLDDLLRNHRNKHK